VILLEGHKPVKCIKIEKDEQFLQKIDGDNLERTKLVIIPLYIAFGNYP
jgi:hypothetical protein